MLVKDVMAKPFTVPEDMPMREVAATMVRQHASAVVVVGAKGEPRGIVTERDFLESGELPYSERGGPTVLRIPLGSGAGTALADARTLPARRIMRPLDAILAPDDVLEKALDLMHHRGKRNVVVLEDGKAVGIIGATDFVRLAAGDALAPRRLELV